MARLAILFALAACVVCPAVVAQQIFDVWSTTWDRSRLFAYTNLGSNPINFVAPGSAGSADIVVDDSTVLQSMVGFGATLTDSSALLLNDLKRQNSGNYWSILKTLFDPTDGAYAAGLSYLRVPLGASDFSASLYSFNDRSGDISLSSFSIDNAPSDVFSVIHDIQGINPYLKVHLLPWSPPGWMKDSGSMNGGRFISEFSNAYAQYLLKALQGFRNKGIKVYAIGIQNEPENNNPTYPTCIITPDQEAQIGIALRSLMDSNGFSNVRIVGYEHNWNDAGAYPVQVINDAPDAFSGAAFHCYSGAVGQQDNFVSAHPEKEVYFTECSGLYGSDWWSDIKWYMDNIFIGAVEHHAKSALMWALALDGNGEPKLPGTDSCGTPCRPVVTINSDGSFTYNQEFYAMAQASKAIIPKDANGPFGQRIAVSVGGGDNWALRVSAFVTARTNTADWERYSLVVLNWNDNSGGAWKPTPVSTTINFRGKQARYTFPVGVTTLWWYAPKSGKNAKREEVRFSAANATLDHGGAIDSVDVDDSRDSRLFRFHRGD